ncbi:RNA polymerase sigma factor [Parapedobacter tibetensis]|uniref:RNA polymerase sigma factor n=1 Tax=Parapedobacter tibetensis TaxID=2972951 RepID=UPI00214D9B68|nr:sigma-70 family RNA polymerase sigma factor [Parapedobacter tibetensis]
MMTKTPVNNRKTTAREALFIALYQRIFPLVARYVAKRGGHLDEAKDIFHDALVIYYEKVLTTSLVLEHNEEAYVFGIARHLWTKRYKENLRYASLDQLMATFEDDETAVDKVVVTQSETAIASQRIVHVLQAAGKKCMKLLMAFYYEKLEMGEVASRFGFSGIRSATVQKFKCLQKARQVVKERSLQYEDFVE